MKIALFGASGFIGSRILAEAERRNHDVTAITRVRADILDAEKAAEAIRGHDVVISAIGSHEKPQIVVEVARTLIQAAKRAGVKRALIVGGAGSLEVAPGVQLVDTPGFPAEWKNEAFAQRDALAVYIASQDIDWTYVSPAAEVFPGERTTKFRLGADALVVDAKSESRISAEDYAVALIDEVEEPRHLRKRFTVAY